ncbi:mechanosensitive ion channel family protein [Puia sp. P3]|uniref:mechanosensitive ion channel family protein n=1 Tax=Puia sp. P3 TaxID=3423952 RepID=UPI003D6679ED
MKASIYPVINKITEILLAISFANVLIGVIKVFEDYIYHHFDIQKADNLKERKIRTQLQFIRRIAIGLIVILTVCAILLSFNNLRKIGTGLLTGVGVGGIIIGFAAQKSLGNLLAGFQLAFTQPLRIDDVLVVEGEWGRVEEITLTYVVLNIWDQRRLILPINYFVEKPFQNWTRNTADILGTVFLYLDYTTPIDPLREEFHPPARQQPALGQTRQGHAGHQYLRTYYRSPRPDERQQLPGNAFDLRCDVREGLLKFLQQQYPHCFPVTRALIEKEDRPILRPPKKEDASHPSEKGERVGEPEAYQIISLTIITHHNDILRKPRTDANHLLIHPYLHLSIVLLPRDHFQFIIDPQSQFRNIL